MHKNVCAPPRKYMPFKMHRGNDSSTRKRRRTRRIFLVTVALVIVTAVWSATHWKSNTALIRNDASAVTSEQSPHEEPSDAYPLYPYSVIPHGAHSRAALDQAIAHDPVVQKHYEDFDYANAKVVKLVAARTAYMSYRIGSQIYWTRGKMRLKEGEELLTDGLHYARARCGNRISDVPEVPTRRKDPPPEAFDTPVERRIAELPQLGPPVFWWPPPWESTQGPPPSPLPPVVVPPAGPGTPGFPIIPIVPIVPGGGPFPGVLPPPLVPPTPVTPVPEPATMILVGSGFAAWIVARRRK